MYSFSFLNKRRSRSDPSIIPFNPIFFLDSQRRVNSDWPTLTYRDLVLLSMRAPVVVALVIASLVGVVAGFYVYDRFNGGSASSCGDPASISSHIYNPYRLQIVKSCITASGT